MVMQNGLASVAPQCPNSKRLNCRSCLILTSLHPHRLWKGDPIPDSGSLVTHTPQPPPVRCVLPIHHVNQTTPPVSG